MHFFSGLYSGILSKDQVHETVPRKVSPQGDYISHNLTSFEDEGQVHFNISLNDREHLLILEPVRNFFAPALITERRKRDSLTRSKLADKSKNCHFQGIVHGQLNSRVAVSTCNGLVSLWKIFQKFSIFFSLLRMVDKYTNTTNYLLVNVTCLMRWLFNWRRFNIPEIGFIDAEINLVDPEIKFNSVLMK